MENYIIYQRVSTKEQAQEGISLEAMKASCLRYIKSQQNGKLIKVYEDAGISGSTIDQRPALKELIQDIKTKTLPINIVLVWKLDRLSRSRKDLDFLKEFLDCNKIELHAASDGRIDTSTASGNLTFGLNGLISQYFRDDIAEKTYNALYNKATNKEFNGGTPPLGYIFNPNNHYIIEEEKAHIIRYIFQKYLETKSFNKVAIILNKEGHKTARGKSWDATQVKRTLANPIYKGAYVWNRTKKNKTIRIKREQQDWILQENHHPAIINKSSWIKTQKIISKNGRKQNKNQITTIPSSIIFTNGQKSTIAISRKMC